MMELLMPMILTIAEGVFWCCVTAVLSTYVVYPVVLAILTKLYRRPSVAGESTPSVTFVISAYNEAGIIREKLENTLKLDYPREQLDIVVVSDASDDGTDEIVRSFEDRGVRLWRQEPRGGKSRGLSAFVPQANSDITLFSDANSMYEPDAMRLLTRHFADATVGYVVGRQEYKNDEESAVGASEGLYWRYELFIKQCESSVGSVVGADGAIYAIRTPLFSPLRDDDINDLVNPLQIVSQGYRGVFEHRAVCYESTAEDYAGEFRRKVRIVNRSFRGLLRVPTAMNPFRVGRFALQVIVHKLIRWFVPFLLLGILATNVTLAVWGNLPFYQLTLGVQVAFYTTALLHFMPGTKRLRVVHFAFYFCMVNLAAALGILSFVGRRRFTTWNPERPQPSDCSDVRPADCRQATIE